MRDGDEVAKELGAGAAQGESPTAWFDRLYAGAAAGENDVPWDRGAPHPLLVSWLGARRLDGLRAVVPGAGPGWDAELLAERGADVTAFDVSPLAMEQARRAHTGSAVTYAPADLFDLPAEWAGAFDLVVEAMTVQSMPRRVRQDAVAAVCRLVAPGGTLLVIGSRLPAGMPLEVGPPWCLTEDELAGFEQGGLRRTAVRDEPSGAAVRYLVALRRDI